LVAQPGQARAFVAAAPARHCIRSFEYAPVSQLTKSVDKIDARLAALRM
jgi:hypothetical protein